MTSERLLELPSLLKSRLEAGEDILWMDGPNKLRCAVLQTAWAVLGAYALVYVALWARQSIASLIGPAGGPQQPALAFVLFGLPATLLALVALFSPLSAFVRGARTLYAITSRRVVVMRGPGEGGFETFAPSDLTGIAVDRAVGKTGDVRFARPGQTLATGETLRHPIILQAVNDPHRVAEILRDLASTSPAAA